MGRLGSLETHDLALVLRAGSITLPNGPQSGSIKNTVATNGEYHKPLLTRHQRRSIHLSGMTSGNKLFDLGRKPANGVKP